MDGRTPSGATNSGAVSGPVGFIGLGNIGAPMATRLLAWPGGLVVHDAAPGATDGLVELGAERGDDAADLATRCELVCVMVNTEAQVREVLDGPHGVFAGAARRSGPARAVVAVHSTISPRGARELAESASANGVDLLDVAVSGGAMGAHEGTLALLVGGDEEAFGRCREPLSMMGSLVRHFGPAGAGTQAKVVRNLITFASFVAVGEASRLAEAAGLDLVALGEVVRHSDAVTGGPGAVMLRDTVAPLPADDPLRAIFEHTAELGEKDLALAVAMATELDVDAPVAAAAAEQLRTALGVGP